jgi:hypothetical protein
MSVFAEAFSKLPNKRKGFPLRIRQLRSYTSDDNLSSGVYIAHLTNLVIPLLDIVLVDADGVYPEHHSVFGVPYVTQSKFQIHCHIDSSMTQYYKPGVIGISPGVRESEVLLGEWDVVGTAHWLSRQVCRGPKSEYTYSRVSLFRGQYSNSGCSSRRVVSWPLAASSLAVALREVTGSTEHWSPSIAVALVSSHFYIEVANKNGCHSYLSCKIEV